jgi:hypothetical protein
MAAHLKPSPGEQARHPLPQAGEGLKNNVSLSLEIEPKLPSLKGREGDHARRCVLWSRGLGMRGEA